MAARKDTAAEDRRAPQGAPAPSVEALEAAVIAVWREAGNLTGSAAILAVSRDRGIDPARLRAAVFSEPRYRGLNCFAWLRPGLDEMDLYRVCHALENAGTMEPGAARTIRAAVNDLMIAGEVDAQGAGAVILALKGAAGMAAGPCPPHEDMEAAALARTYRQCEECLAGPNAPHPDSPAALSTGDYMLDLRYEYHDLTGRNISEERGTH